VADELMAPGGTDMMWLAAGMGGKLTSAAKVRNSTKAKGN